METKFNYVTLRMELDKEIKINNSILTLADAADFFKEQIGDLDRETMALLCLNTKNEPNSFHLISAGTLNSSMLSPREVFKTAILSNANSIMIAHNHPSGSCDPSDADLNSTLKISKSGDLLGIRLLDHIIVGPFEDEFFSFRQSGILNENILTEAIEIGEGMPL